ncbi:unnamed protein product [Paramecium pentaurelia]|uniref:Uncharacterized protein n=1 Tax=Paramecium pentaurelia TaxID=43138 RepID=A0A8S1VVC1_9CILI|nr:unnamed protein product [Paramecium pentaurelia]
MQDQRYQYLIGKYHFQLEQFNFNKAFVKRCLVSKDQRFVAISVRGCYDNNLEKKNYHYYYQIWSLEERKCIKTYQIILCSPISQFMCGFSECSQYFVSFNCNCEMTIVHLEAQKECFTVSLPGHQVIDKLMIKQGLVFIIVEQLIYVYSLVDGTPIQKIELDFKQENFLPLDALKFLVSNNQRKSVQIWQRIDKGIKKQKEIFPKNRYDELFDFENRIIIGQQQMCIHLLSPSKLQIIRKITIEYQFYNIIIDHNISILNIYRSLCPEQKKLVYFNCFPEIQTFESNHHNEVDYTFENMYFYSGIVVGWDYDNPNKVGFMIYKFSN